MQRNPGAVTIEDELEKAIVAAGGISPENAGDFQKVGWMRAARTDKGVSAVGQCVSLRMMLEHPTDERDVIVRINERLPEGFEIFGYTRVTGGFSAKTMCDRRRYEYVIPVAAFDPKACRPKREAEAEDGEGGDDDSAGALGRRRERLRERLFFGVCVRRGVSRSGERGPRPLPRHAQLPQLHRPRLPRRPERVSLHPLLRVRAAVRGGRRSLRPVRRRRAVVHASPDSQTHRHRARRPPRRVERGGPAVRAEDEGELPDADGAGARPVPVRVRLPRVQPEVRGDARAFASRRVRGEGGGV